MSVLLFEREQCEFPVNGANALKPEQFFKPKLKIVPKTEIEFTPKPITLLSEYRERKNREQIMKQPIEALPKPETSKETPKLIKEKKEFIPGFSVVDEASSVVKTYNESKAKGKSHEEAFDETWKNHEGNLIRYHFEYTMRFPVLVNPVALNDQGHFVNADSDRRLLDMTSPDERNGAVRQSVLRTEQLLKDAKEGEVVIAPSPAGGTGKYINGKELVYGETEIFLYEKLSEREIRAFTFIVDLSYEQTLQVCKYFINPDANISDLSLPQSQRIEAMVANPFLIPKGVTSAHQFLRTVEEVKGDNIMRKANGANRTFKEGHELIDLEDDLKLLPQKVKASRDLYKAFLGRAISRNEDSNVIELIEQKMGISLLEDIRIIEGKIDHDSPQVSTNFREAMNSSVKVDRRFIEQNYGAQINFMRLKMVGLGCNNPSESSNILGSSLSEVLSGYSSGGRGIGESSSGLAPKCINCKLELCEGRCPNCEKRASRTP